MHTSAKTDLDSAIADLCTGAIFFCMRSCEYSKVPRQQDKKIKLLCLRNLRFFQGSTLLQQDPDELDNATLISITFEDQKNREKNQTINLHKSKDNLLCPVRAWAKVVRRIRSYKGSSRDSPVNSFQLNDKPVRITNANITQALRSTVDIMKDNYNLGFSSAEVGTHSIRLGGAMAMCLAKLDVYMVKIIGRWKSDAFMKYIRKQIQQFTSGISDKMVSMEHFTHVPNDESLQSEPTLKKGWWRE